MGKKLTQQETEKLIGGIREAYEAKIRQLNYRIDSLNVENRNLRASLAEYKNKESKVGKAIVAAEEKGEEIVRLYRMTAEAELKTLRLFAVKWRKLAEQMIGVFPDDEAEKYILRSLEQVNPDSGIGVILEHAGDIAAARGKTAEAELFYRRSLRLGKDDPGFEPEAVEKKLELLKQP